MKIILKEPAKTYIINFLDKRIIRLQKRNKNNATSIGRLIDLKNLIENDMEISDPPKYVIEQINTHL